LKQFDAQIVQHYHEWVEHAPDSYKDDTFFLDRQPVAITSRYGQNQELCPAEADQDQEGLSWSLDRNYHRVESLSVAIATHLR
jgi:hypothetical protein